MDATDTAKEAAELTRLKEEMLRLTVAESELSHMKPGRVSYRDASLFLLFDMDHTFLDHALCLLLVVVCSCCGAVY
jgi:hypothetical protein